ncbi:MAG: hypothetical protein L0Y56_16895 [Nitrospira sp.]|nr:hypothetical protein [Nitrospira sp.]
MAEVVQLRKPTSRLAAKKSARKKNVLEVLADVDIHKMPEDCQEVNLLCNLFGHPVWIEIITLKKFFEEKGKHTLYKLAASRTFEEYLKEETKKLQASGHGNSLEDLFDDPAGYFKRIYGSIEGYMQELGLMHSQFHLPKITRRSIYMVLKQMYPFFQDFSFKKAEREEIVQRGEEAIVSINFDYIK